MRFRPTNSRSPQIRRPPPHSCWWGWVSRALSRHGGVRIAPASARNLRTRLLRRSHPPLALRISRGGPGDSNAPCWIPKQDVLEASLDAFVNNGRRTETSLAPGVLRPASRSVSSAPTDYVFASRTGRPLGQRNVGRALRQAQTIAVDDIGRPLFLHFMIEMPAGSGFLPPARAVIASMRSCWQTVASRALLAGESTERTRLSVGPPRCDRHTGCVPA
jgi:hypothetical protein